jgi:hypothetical protein
MGIQAVQKYFLMIHIENQKNKNLVLKMNKNLN